jgi:hypothetical protein
MKEHPTIFSTEMVRAIREGGKTQTRRVIKHNIIAKLGYITERDTYFFKLAEPLNQVCTIEIKCPYGKIGDVLWVRETWNTDGDFIDYKADLRNDLVSHAFAPPNWKSPYHMPRHACRIFLEVTNIRVERLHDITEEDAIAEGIYKPKWYFKEVCDIPDKQIVSDYLCYFDYEFRKDYHYETAIHSYSSLWNSINKKRGYEWDLTNPWVWVVEFKQLRDYEKDNTTQVPKDDGLFELVCRDKKFLSKTLEYKECFFDTRGNCEIEIKKLISEDKL